MSRNSKNPNFFKKLGFLGNVAPIALTALFLHEGIVSEGLLETHWLFEDLLLFPKLIGCLKSPLIGIKTLDPPSHP